MRLLPPIKTHEEAVKCAERVDIMLDSLHMQLRILRMQLIKTMMATIKNAGYEENPKWSDSSSECRFVKK